MKKFVMEWFVVPILAAMEMRSTKIVLYWSRVFASWIIVAMVLLCGMWGMKEILRVYIEVSVWQTMQKNLPPKQGCTSWEFKPHIKTNSPQV